MSRIGKLPILLPDGVDVTLEKGSKVIVKGVRGSIERILPRGLSIEKQGQNIIVKKNTKSEDTSMYGTYRSHIANMVKGVSEGWEKKLELVGTGYRAEVSGNDLVLTVGYSHPVNITAPAGISFKVEKSIITVEGIDKEAVGQTSAKIRSVRPPEPYKGKGIKYINEVIRRKVGKAAKTTGAS